MTAKVTPTSPTFVGTSQSPAQTVALGKAVAAQAQIGDLIALVGELGAGKTQFVRGLAAGRGLRESVVSSPTFVLMHEYESDDDSPVLVHIDAYRINTPSDLTSIGWDTIGGTELRDCAIVVVEWADRVEDALGDDRLDVELAHVSSDTRSVRITARGSWRSRIGAVVDAATAGGLRLQTEPMP